MIIMCAKCKKPARIDQRVEGGNTLVITAVCHGEREEMRLSKAELQMTPGLHAQIDKGTGVAFQQVSPADKLRAEMARADGWVEVPAGVDPRAYVQSVLNGESAA